MTVCLIFDCPEQTQTSPTRMLERVKGSTFADTPPADEEE
jgi:hypothetical protein